MLKILDIYFKAPILTDIVLGALIVFVPIDPGLFEHIKFLDTDKNLDIISNLISSCVSLAGFIIAALTVIVTFRSSIATKNLQNAANALELIVSSKLYPLIVKVYTGVILEFILLSLTLYMIWISFSNIEVGLSQSRIVFSGVVCTGLTFFRSLWILNKVLQAEQAQKN